MSKSPSNSLALSTVENRLGSAVNVVEGNQGLTQIDTHNESQDLVELYYENHGSSNVLYHPNSIQNPLTQVSTPAKKLFSYKCDLCNREFKEASHFSKHKRGALCHKIVQKLAKKNKQSKDGADKKGAVLAATYKPYQCNLCGAKFFDKVNVELHLERTHQTQQPLWTEVAKTSGFACSECDLWFSDKIQLKHHQIQHSSLPNNQSCDSITNDINHHPIVHHQYFSQPLSHIAPSFSPNALHHSYPQLTPVSSLPQAQPLYQMLQQHHSPQIQQSPVNSSLLITTSPNDGNNIPSSSQPQMPMGYPNFTNNGTSSTSVQTNTNKQQKPSKSDRCINSSIWNVCGDCGQKFIDPINLELHLQRKHPHSNIVETVSLSGGQTLYKTNNFNKNINTHTIDSVTTNSSDKNKLFECEVMSDLAQLPITQNKQSGNSGNVESTELKDKKKLKSLKRNMMESPLKSSSHKCDICKKDFCSNAELIRHRVKDKNIMCGVCSFSSCHNLQVAMHMYSCHKETEDNCPNLISPKVNEFCNPVNNITPSNQCEELSSIETSNLLNKESSIDKDGEPSRLCCCMCSFYAKSGVSLAQHLQSHGSIHVKCGKCGETSSSFVEINNHINSSHCNEVIRVTLTMKASHTPAVYMFLITPKNLGSPASNTLDNSSNNNGLSKPISFQEVYIYACSECGASLTGQYQLEAHLQLHQNNAASVCRDIAVNTPESFSIDPSSGPSPLIHTQKTVEFRCQECGFWREQSDSVIKHIQSVHMSAKMVHSQRQNTGRIVGQTIHVFTPLSSMVSN